MNPDRWEELKKLFDQAAELMPEQRKTLLTDVHSRDPELAAELAKLLSSTLSETVPIDRPAFVARSLFGQEFCPLYPGDTLIGRFRIVRCIGRGGMGEVYEADDKYMGRIAIKIISPGMLRSEDAVELFKEEAIAARRITSPNVCRIYEFLIAPPENGRPELAFLTMEFLEGSTLWDRIDREGAFSPTEAQRIAIELCRGLQAIHAAGVVHRDLKTRNIMLVERQSSLLPVIMDFGLALQAVPRVRAAAANGAGRTVVGTPEYMSPEQFEGRDITRTADIYSLGIVLYEIATGKHPFPASTPLGAAVRRARRPPPIRALRADFPHRWDNIVDRCLQYDSEQRYQTAEEVVHALTHRASNLVKVDRSAIDAKTRKLLAWMAVAVAFLCAAGVSMWLLNRPHRPPPEATRLFKQGVDALRNGTYLKASRLLSEAVNADPHFALAYARLADAFSELDFKEKAEHEMLYAVPEGSDELTGDDSSYLKAVRASLSGDSKSAVKKYIKILNDLPKADKAIGYFDLGRAYEKTETPLTRLEPTGPHSGKSLPPLRHLCGLPSLKAARAIPLRPKQILNSPKEPTATRPMSWEWLKSITNLVISPVLWIKSRWLIPWSKKLCRWLGGCRIISWRLAR